MPRVLSLAESEMANHMEAHGPNGMRKGMRMAMEENARAGNSQLPKLLTTGHQERKAATLSQILRAQEMALQIQSRLPRRALRWHAAEGRVRTPPKFPEHANA